MSGNYVINIGRQLGSGGKEIGEKLAARLGIDFYDKELINLASEESGLCKEFFEKADEKASQGIIGGLFGMRFPFISEGAMPCTNCLSNDALFKVQSDVIRRLSGSNETAGKERAPMKGATSIQERLWELRKDKGLNLEELSKLTGISKSALGSYEKEDFKEINHGNLITLADFYGVSVDYLLCRTENREQINTPLTELHLNDEMVALLKSGRINNRLLCELATHKDFIKFLADIEIYVDGIATMQIQNLNALVDTVRHEIIERYRPGEDDPHLKVLQAAHISDDEYFSHMVLDDLNLIIRDIREAHKKDSESAPQTTVADELKENLEAVENFKGSRDEKLVVLYCKQLGINYKNLSDEEFRWLIRILKKSKKMGTPISQRKKR